MYLSIKDPLTVSMSTIIRNVSVNIVRLRKCFIMKKFVYPLEHICVPPKKGYVCHDLRTTALHHALVLNRLVFIFYLVTMPLCKPSSDSCERE